MLRNLLILSLLFGSAALHAEKYAIIIGAGKFPHYVHQDGTPAMDLDGARPDAERLAEVLSTKFGYSRANMTVLIDTDNSRRLYANINCKTQG